MYAGLICLVLSYLLSFLLSFLLPFLLSFLLSRSDLDASFIFTFLLSTYSIFKAIVLLLHSNFLQLFECEGNSISFQLQLLINGLSLEILLG